MHHHPYNQERAINLSILNMSGMLFQQVSLLLKVSLFCLYLFGVTSETLNRNLPLLLPEGPSVTCLKGQGKGGHG